jgi:hypothetical protein
MSLECRLKRLKGNNNTKSMSKKSKNFWNPLVIFATLFFVEMIDFDMQTNQTLAEKREIEEEMLGMA